MIAVGVTVTSDFYRAHDPGPFASDELATIGDNEINFQCQ
jgi:hypothetical protein